MASTATAHSGNRSEDVIKYTTTAMWFHWIIAALVIGNLAVGSLHDVIPVLDQFMGIHQAIGLTVLVLAAGRLAWRMTHPAPPLPAPVALWERMSAYATHYTFYALLFIMPLTGWGLVSAGHKRPLTWFGLFDVPRLPISVDTSKLAHSAHGLFGWVMLGLVALHIAAALRHRFILHDHVLARMAPSLDK